MAPFGLDKAIIHDWRDLQSIKNQICGEECEALEIYPAESRLVDGANQYHLFAFLTPGFRLPLGFQDRMVLNETKLLIRSSALGCNPTIRQVDGTLLA